jgi:hypothetical protein
MDRLAGPQAVEEAPLVSAPPVEPIAHDVPGVPDLIPPSESLEADLGATDALPEIEPAEFEISAVTDPEVMASVEVEVGGTAGPELSEPVEIEPELAGPQGGEPLAGDMPGEPEAARSLAQTEPRDEVVPVPCVVDPFDFGYAAAAEPAPAIVPESESSPAAAVPAIEPESASPPAAEMAAPAPEPASEAGAGPDAFTLDAETEGITAEPPAPVVTPAPLHRPVRRPAWPDPEDVRVPRRPLSRGTWLVAGIVVALFCAGWILGRLDLSGARRGLASALDAVGLGPARYELTVTSRPSGAWITVDGVDRALRTPATLPLKPGAHVVVLSLSGVGGSSHAVQGKRGERVALDVELWGTLRIIVPDGGVPVAVMVDGTPQGVAPLTVDRLSPGIHRLQFSGPGVAPWEQTVEVHVNGTAEVVAQPITSPPTGLLEVRATLSDEAGSEPLTGATVWIDGERRGVTPLKLELPRGPHSIRVHYHEDEAPIQVMDLPGGNERFATVDFGLIVDHPSLQSSLPGRVPLDRPTVVSASIDHAREGDVREMWLHVRTPEGAWRSYPMSVMKATGGVVGVAVFPSVLFDAHGRAAWYVSASTPTGDEYFTEIQAAQAATTR